MDAAEDCMQTELPNSASVVNGLSPSATDQPPLEIEASHAESVQPEQEEGDRMLLDQPVFSIGKQPGNKGVAKKGKKSKHLRFRKAMRDKTDYANCRGEQPNQRLITLNVYLEPRMDATMQSVRRTDTIHMFGIDVMGTCDIFSYFGGFSPMNIEWINDSSCNVAFAKDGCVVDALTKLSKPIKSLDVPEEHMKDKKFCQTYLWHRARPFLKGSLKEKVHLMLRMATVDDVKSEAEPRVTRQLWLKETHMATQLLKKGMLDHELSHMKDQKKKKKRAEPVENEQLPKKKKKGPRQKKPSALPAAHLQEEDTEPMCAPEDSSIPLPSGDSLLPPDLRDFISRLRAEHDIGP